MKRLVSLVLLVSTAAFTACGGSDPASTGTVTPPSIGKADGSDRADTSCQIVLRTAKTAYCSGGICVYIGEVDISKDIVHQGAKADVLVYDGGWSRVSQSGTPLHRLPDVVAGFERYQFTLTSTAAQVEVIPYYELNGVRSFDHNRNGDVFANYVVGPNQYIHDDASACAKPLVIDRGDHDCNVIMRSSAPGFAVNENNEKQCSSMGCFVLVAFDVASSKAQAGAIARLAYSTTAGNWTSITAYPDKSASAPAGFVRYSASITFYDTSVDELRVIPMFEAGNEHFFDNNITSSHYIIGAVNDWNVQTDPRWKAELAQRCR
jgi:hypothetical protein